MLLALIPYIIPDDEAADVWIIPVSEVPTTPEAVLPLLANFADMDSTDREAIADHCAAYHADRIILPNPQGLFWRAIRIDDVLAGQLVDVY
ncbi:hypothetical protein SAMN00768000_3592 [Sulfobacillus thermosulfidooxidans DSM 9293]|uniref:Uncharacterized protein n=1 Tax=Sulfobacillus thermosulfidooxidans (strain DSM 9293 / VKM B-1269 / AT-1) TaxID=929705 RepID=A0A1W1WPS2_SULTA|nr:hypothetical protein [Sulfobacillus thermosulfidooxidans]SMC08010.1 hypothetical protein SAMN00768000_3592 [Sulfobacillus thermosulfidooxidans DSM 9293]